VAEKYQRALANWTRIDNSRIALHMDTVPGRLRRLQTSTAIAVLAQIQPLSLLEAQRVHSTLSSLSTEQASVILDTTILSLGDVMMLRADETQLSVISPVASTQEGGDHKPLLMIVAIAVGVIGAVLLLVGVLLYCFCYRRSVHKQKVGIINSRVCVLRRRYRKATIREELESMQFDDKAVQRYVNAFSEHGYHTWGQLRAVPPSQDELVKLFGLRVEHAEQLLRRLRQKSPRAYGFVSQSFLTKGAHPALVCKVQEEIAYGQIQSSTAMSESKLQSPPTPPSRHIQVPTTKMENGITLVLGHYV